MNEKRCQCDNPGDAIPTIDDGMCCIDTYRIFDSCRKKQLIDRARILLTDEGQALLNRSNNARVKSVKVLWTQISSSDLPYNYGYYQVNIRYYFFCTIETCQGCGEVAEINGLAIWDDSTVLYGGVGDVACFKSTVSSGFCSLANPCNHVNNMPTVALEIAEPVALKLDVTDNCGCNSPLPCNLEQIPEDILSAFRSPLGRGNAEKIAFITLGIFVVIRMERPSQIIVPACDFCIPDENEHEVCESGDPARLFNAMSFPLNEFYPDTQLCSRKR